MTDIESQNLEAQIRVRAYHLWEAEGRPEGRAEEFWQLALAESIVPKKAVKRRAKAVEKVEEKPAKKKKAEPVGASATAKAAKPRKAAEPKAPEAKASPKKSSRAKAKLEAQS